MEEPEQISDDTLLDFLLERCDEAQAARVAAALGRDAVLAARLERLRQTLAPLDTWTTPPPPASMVDDILDAIAAQSATSAIGDQRAASALPPDVERGRGGRPILSLRELVALAACITIFVGIIVPSISSSRFKSRQQACAGNLASLFRGTSSYTQAYAGLMPSVARQPGQPWLKTAGKPARTNRSNMYLVLRGGYVKSPKLFVCQARKSAQEMSPEDVDRNTDFPERRNCSYDLQRIAGPVPMRLTILARRAVPLISDANPLFEDGRFNSDLDPKTTNSTSHAGYGQNVLHADGRVHWRTSPVLDAARDNMWLAGSNTDYDGTEVPASATDVFIVP